MTSNKPISHKLVTNKKVPSNNLCAQSIELYGKHLIEASAGTGKTYNITRLYLRLLLERRLSVEQILVMTFTKDATEELRGRIESTIRQAINQWQTLVKEDDYFAAIAERISAEEVSILLKKALLFLDEASIYTIHGFCKRVLSQHAFASGLPFNAQMESDCQDLVIEACQDWYRTLAIKFPDEFLIVAEFWSEPERFISTFSKAINQQQTLEVIAPESIIENFIAEATLAHQSLSHHHDDLVIYLVDVKKGQAREDRLTELRILTSWLAELSQHNVEESLIGFLSASPMPDAFLDGRRYGRSKVKAEITEIFSSSNQVKSQAKSLGKKLNKAKAFALVRQGIYQIRAAVVEKKQQVNMLSFDDLISTLATSLSKENDPQGKFAQTLKTQYPVALVDEFQDTDPQQFSILRAVYYLDKGLDKSLDKNLDKDPTETALYMIGDPKQAIYGFRGGDVFAYLAARDDCDHQWLMDTNWRSTPDMIQGYNRLFYGNKLSEQAADVFGYDIPYVQVKAPAHKQALAEQEKATNNSKHDSRKPLQFIHFTPDDPDYCDKKSDKVKQSFRPVMANWCADEIVRLLTEHSPFYGSEHAPDSYTINPQDIAILVRDGTEAKAVKEALNSRQLASVFLSNRANLLHSEQAKQLASLLKGILFVENERFYTASLACGLLGFTPTKLYQLQQDELAWQNLKFDFIELRAQWSYKGFISMALKLMHQHFHIANDDLAQGTGQGSNQDRVLTNLLHLFELLQSASQRHRQPQELLYWFEQQINLDNPETEAELRLESDDDLIRIVTQHGSKGLEYPVVFVPFASRHKDPLKFGNKPVNLIEYHRKITALTGEEPDEKSDEKSGEEPNKRALVLSLDGSTEAKQAMREEAYAEAIRLLYVAVTRAEQRCYIMTTSFDQFHHSPLGLTLKWQEDDDIAAKLQQLVNDEPQAIGLQQLSACNDVPLLYQNNQQQLNPEVASFKGKIERDWWLSSFSALSKNLRHGGVSAPDRDNEPLKGDNKTLVSSNELRFTLAKGAHTGNLLHDILEHCDFSNPNWSQVMKWPLVGYGELNQGLVSAEQTEQSLADWLTQTLQSYLSEADCCLADITLEKSLRESEFYFPMEDANSADLGRLLTKHRQRHRLITNETDQKSIPPVKLPAYKSLKGMMHGFIDLVFEHKGQYFVCDYKSSHLGNHFDDYNHAALKDNVEKNYYDLQYLIYCLALHRHLEQCLPDYDPALHFGGIYYFYLRGMTGDKAQLGSGVYYQKITVDELTALDQLFKETT